MANNVKTYELASMVASAGEEIETYMKEGLNLSEACSALSEQYVEAAEYYKLLSVVFKDLTNPVDVYCSSSETIEIDGNDLVLNELVESGYITEVGSSSVEDELEDKVLYADNCDVPFDTDSLEGPDSWASDEEDYYRDELRGE